MQNKILKPYCLKCMSSLEKHHKRINPLPQGIMEADKEMCIQDNNNIVISHLPNHNRDEEDITAMFLVDLVRR